MRGRLVEFVLLNFNLRFGELGGDLGAADLGTKLDGRPLPWAFCWITCGMSFALEAQTQILASERFEKSLVCLCISNRPPHMLPIYSKIS